MDAFHSMKIYQQKHKVKLVKKTLQESNVHGEKDYESQDFDGF